MPTYQVAIRTPLLDFQEDSEGDGFSTIGHFGHDFDSLNAATGFAYETLSQPGEDSRASAWITKDGKAIERLENSDLRAVEL